MRIYPFFIVCGKHETGFKKTQLDHLGIGIGGLFITRKKKHYLICAKGEFEIPETFSQKAYKKLQQILWTDDLDYYNLQNVIMESQKNWINVKKKNKFKLVDCYSIRFKNSVYVKAALTLALILKLIDGADIEYKNGEISNINLKNIPFLDGEKLFS